MKHAKTRWAIIVLIIGAGTFWVSGNILRSMAKEPSHRTAGLSLLATAHEKAANGNAPLEPKESQAEHRIIYIQAVRYKPGISKAQIEALLESARNTMRKIPQVKSIQIGRVVDAGSPYDYALVMEFDSLDDLKAYGRSEIHRRWVEEHHTPGLAAAYIRMTILTEPDK